MKIVVREVTYQVKGNKISCKMDYIIKNSVIPRINNLNQTAFGSAICHNEDKFDFNKGAKIALAKAERCAYEDVSRAMKRKIKLAKSIITDGESFIKKADRIVNHNGEYIHCVANDIDFSKKNSG